MTDRFNIIRGAVGDLRRIYNSLILTDALFYRPLEAEEFNRIFNMDGTLTLSAVVGDEPIGFLSARLPNGEGVSYLTYFGVLPEYRSNSCASALLDEAERILRDDHGAKRIDIVFHNPAHLPWIIPGSTDGHPCAPGIASDHGRSSMRARDRIRFTRRASLASPRIYRMVRADSILYAARRIHYTGGAVG